MQTFKEKYKYNAFNKYSNELETIIAPKKYNPSISNMLRLSFPIMIEYYGHEYKDILFDTLKQIDIVIPENNESMYDIVKKYTPSNIEKKSEVNAVNDGELKRASGVHSVNPIFEIKNGEIALVGKSEVVSFKNFSNQLDTLSTFVHELSHAFKSSQNSMNLLRDEQGNQFLITRNGLSITYSKVYLENDKVIIEDIQEKNIGLEEGINTYDENNIINKILSIPKENIPSTCHELRNSLSLPPTKTEYVSSGYRQETLCADKLFNKCNLDKTIRHDQFLGTANCEKVYNSLLVNKENNWENLNDKIDLSVRHTYARFKHIWDTDWFEKHKSEIIGNLQNIHSMLDEYAEHVKLKSIELKKEQD